ncbi:hypothetical protein [Legionella hackeliae]|uniref:Periplasmic ligand-binding sensor domain protein n=1 Tax=Legionella hackeliae TaxID=449 RepID=A0A0A8UNH1_LEGHA|nr:hypothetical protein [Legionella hackeliae]KTD08872.1 periplasmic ligand-binding sensor domain protein [Legionella hackeliae]CEK10303.1 conserved protein of unknown function [Legionella hackeliae]STX47031.1 periplasmic ligand-binding sensor domain protein [Legionella hackeliae]
MQERREIDKTTDANNNNIYNSPAYMLANVTFKTALISFSVSALTQPFQATLTHFQLQSGATSSLKNGLFRGLYRGFFPYALAGQKRGAVAVSAKQANREVTEEQLEAELPIRQRWLGTFLFSQADLLISNGLGNKSKLESANIITNANFNWSFTNYVKLTWANWGSRTASGFINFAALGFVGDYISSFYKFEDEFYNKLCGGATAGVIATALTTVPNSYADRKILASKMENGRLLTVSPYTMFRQMQAQVKTGGRGVILDCIRFTLFKEFLIRSPQSALTFSIIFGLDHALGIEPLRKIWPKSKEKPDTDEIADRVSKGL